MSKKIGDEELIETMKERLDEFKNALRNQKELEKQLAEVNKKLDEAEAFKSHFIARISNEIINPFTSIIGIADNILQSESGNRNETRKMVEHIYNEAFFLDFQLRNLFTAAKIEAGEVEKEIVSTQPAKLIHSCLDSFNKEIEKKNVRFEKDIKIGDDQQFKTDPDKVKLIIKNLISNAVKYSEGERRVSLVAALNNSEFYFSIENEGKKISGEQQETIFDRFRQLDTRIHSLNPGSGIGLSICRELTDVLNGSIEATQTNDGMKFTIIIPESEDPSEGFDPSGDELFFEDNNTSEEIL